MTLRRTMAYQIAALIVGSILIGAASLWGLNGLRQDYDLAARGYEQLRHVYLVGSYLESARLLLNDAKPDRASASDQVEKALAQFDKAFRPPAGEANVEQPLGGDEQAETSVYNDLRSAQAQLSGPPGGPSVSGDQLAPKELITRSIGRLRDLDSSVRLAVKTREDAADAKRRTTMLLLALLTGAIVVGAIVIGVRQYRSVATPLRRLSDGVRNIALGHFGEPIMPRGHAEFVSLAQDFNRMAGELDSLYRDLEQKVAIKSRELVRSERLASVGYLAAGVAHEINNPLGIITGYAELALKNLRQQRGQGAVSEEEKTLEVICEEAFRCKEIVEKLLSLARSGEESRRAVRLDELVIAFAQTMAGLKQYQDRKLITQIEAREDSVVLANATELRQVLLNLTINAFEAAQQGAGEVTISLRRSDDSVELSVRDNGRGMDAQTLDRVFEPFFTDKRGRGQRGTGLGLSITHAIVESHGGTITAESAGPGRGCNFTVRLPYYQVRTTP